MLSLISAPGTDAVLFPYIVAAVEIKRAVHRFGDGIFIGPILGNATDMPMLSSIVIVNQV